MRVMNLVSAMNTTPRELIQKMNIRTGACIVIQADRNEEETWEESGELIRTITRKERGVGLSRNAAMDLVWENFDGICLFSDEDIVYEDDYEKRILQEYEAHPEADGILFNVQVCEERRTYWNQGFRPVKWYCYGRYPAYSISIKNEVLKASGCRYSLLFGGGAKYSNGEDSLFLSDLLKAGVKLYSSEVCIGREEERPSTWFEGYTDKFFFDRGVLYAYLYGVFAMPLAFRFLKKHQGEMLTEKSMKEAFRLMRHGIAEGRMHLRAEKEKSS